MASTILFTARRVGFSPSGRLALRTMATVASPGSTMPPGHIAKVGHLETFQLPNRVTGSASDKAMGEALIEAWKRDGIFQIAMNPTQHRIYKQAENDSKRYFAKPHDQKAACVDSQSYAGYIASGEEITDGVADYSEIFTATKDLDVSDPRVVNKWPCHGPTPWPDTQMKDSMTTYMNYLGQSGDKLLALTELGLNVPEGSLKRYVQDGWHHMRILR